MSFDFDVLPLSQKRSMLEKKKGKFTMSRFEKSEVYSTQVPSYSQSGNVVYNAAFNLAKSDWGNLAQAIEASLDANITEGNYSKSEVVVINDREVVVFKDATYFGDNSPAIAIVDGDTMGEFSVNLTLGAVHDLLVAIQAEML